jgi:hypothetical protein
VLSGQVQDRSGVRLAGSGGGEDMRSSPEAVDSALFQPLLPRFPELGA